MALPITIIAVLLIGLLVAGGFFASSQELRAGRSAIEQERAMATAEEGLARVLVEWEPSRALSMPVGGVDRLPPWAHNGVTRETLITRLGPLLFWVASEAVASPGHHMEARRRVGAVVRLEVPAVRLPAALTVHLPAGASGGDIGAGLHVTGIDSAPPRWGDCPVGRAPVGGFATDDLALWTLPDTSCPGGPCFEGSPPLLSDPRLSDTASASAEVDEAWRSLTARATIILASGTTVGTADRPLGPVEIDDRCERGDLSNWGDPGRTTSCAGHLPVIWAVGDLHIAGGAGQGVLLVEGDLVLSGGARFVGLILVRGALRTVAPGAEVIGAARVLGENGRRSSLEGGGKFAYSRCALATALAPHARPRIEPRSWTELRR